MCKKPCANADFPRAARATTPRDHETMSRNCSSRPSRRRCRRTPAPGRAAAGTSIRRDGPHPRRTPRRRPVTRAACSASCAGPGARAGHLSPLGPAAARGNFRPADAGQRFRRLSRGIPCCCSSTRPFGTGPGQQTVAAVTGVTMLTTDGWHADPVDAGQEYAAPSRTAAARHRHTRSRRSPCLSARAAPIRRLDAAPRSDRPAWGTGNEANGQQQRQREEKFSAAGADKARRAEEMLAGRAEGEARDVEGLQQRVVLL